MSEWCPTHPKYSAKRQPKSLCGHCWKLWLLKNPELGTRYEGEPRHERQTDVRRH